MSVITVIGVQSYYVSSTARTRVARSKSASDTHTEKTDMLCDIHFCLQVIFG